MVDKGIHEPDRRDRPPAIEPGGREGTRQEYNHPVLRSIQEHLRRGGRLWLFLDYDGTLVPIVRTPQEAKPDAALLKLLTDLASRSNIRTVFLSGRPLAALQDMLPVKGLIRAGLYGVEVEIPGEGVIIRASAESIRKVVDQVKREWAPLVQGRSGFLIEDKGMSVALHSRLADPVEAATVVPQARAILRSMSTDECRILGGELFLEIAPAAAHKGKTVEWLFQHLPFPDAQSIYLGDDDKDEEAFAVIRKHGGVPVIVGARQPGTSALVRLPSYREARMWLEAITNTT